MNDTDRIIGELQEFKRATLGELDGLKKEVRELSEFRWRAAGVVACAMAIVEFAHLLMNQ